MHQYYWQCVNHATISSSMQYWQFLEKKFKQYLIICKPGIKQLLRVEGHLKHLSNRQKFILYICYNRKCKAIMISMFLGFIFNWTPSSMWKEVMNIKSFRSEALMTATKKSTKCRQCFQESVDSSMASRVSRFLHGNMTTQPSSQQYLWHFYINESKMSHLVTSTPFFLFVLFSVTVCLCTKLIHQCS